MHIDDSGNALQQISDGSFLGPGAAALGIMEQSCIQIHARKCSSGYNKSHFSKISILYSIL
jgi:hypothetical protein